MTDMPLSGQLLHNLVTLATVYFHIPFAHTDIVAAYFVKACSISLAM